VKKIISIAAISAALLLTGCSQVSSAASVGSEKISQATVQSSINEIMSERSKVDSSQMQLEVGENLNRSQMRFHVLSALLNKVAEKLKITVTKAEIDIRRAGITEQVGGEEGLPTALVGAGIAPKDFDLYLQSIIISDKLSQALEQSGIPADQIGTAIQRLVVDIANENKVTINPRYGAWDAVNADVVAVDSAGSAVTPSDK
jgi:outer membrane murein-binding lipoprotein Lpp